VLARSLSFVAVAVLLTACSSLTKPNEITVQAEPREETAKEAAPVRVDMPVRPAGQRAAAPQPAPAQGGCGE
jgi:hypothetical protein